MILLIHKVEKEGVPLMNKNVIICVNNELICGGDVNNSLYINNNKNNVNNKTMKLLV